MQAQQNALHVRLARIQEMALKFAQYVTQVHSLEQVPQHAHFAQRVPIH